MSKKRYVVAYGEDDEVMLEVDHEKLTVELATEINSFWSDAERRLEGEGGDVVRAVIRLMAVNVLTEFKGNGWACIYEGQDEIADMLLADTLKAQAEGWPTAAELGIRIVSVLADELNYETMSAVREVEHG